MGLVGLNEVPNVRVPLCFRVQRELREGPHADSQGFRKSQVPLQVPVRTNGQHAHLGPQPPFQHRPGEAHISFAHRVHAHCFSERQKLLDAVNGTFLREALSQKWI